MASISDKVSSTQDNKTESSPSENELPVENQQVKQVNTPEFTKIDEDKEQPVEVEQNESSTSTTIKPDEESRSNEPSPIKFDVHGEKSTAKSSEEANKKNLDRKSKENEPTSSKTRSVNFTSNGDNAEAPKSRSTNSTNDRSSYSSPSKPRSSHRPVDFIDTLVESYKLETSTTSPSKEEKKYVPKTNRSRLNPNWREHRTRRLMNKLEELSLWDREEELKASQAQSLREQKWEQIQDRQRNHDLCLNLMRQRHESEMESAVILDRAASGINDENTSATIARAMSLSSPANTLAYDLPTPPQTLKRRVKKQQENTQEFKTPIGRYRQFETNMDNKLEKINQKLQPDREIMRAYSPYNTSIPITTVPLFSETYSALLSVPDTFSSNKYGQYHHNVPSHLHASSPDYETRLRSYSNRDVRVPLKEQANDHSYHDDDNTDEYNRSSLTDNDRYTKYRSNPIDNDYYTKYRSISHDNDYHPRYRSNPIDNEYYPKYRSKPIDDDDSYSKYRSNPVDDEYYPKYRSKPIDDDDDSYLKYRSNPTDDDYYTKYRSTLTSKLDYSPPRRTTTLASPTASSLYDYTTVANTPREYSFIHSRQPTSNSIHLRSLNDDLNAITRFSTETSKKILQNIGDSPNDFSTKPRSLPSTKHVSFNKQNINDENFNNSSRNYGSKTLHQPVDIISLSSTR